MLREPGSSVPEELNSFSRHVCGCRRKDHAIFEHGGQERTVFDGWDVQDVTVAARGNLTAEQDIPGMTFYSKSC